MHCNDIQIILYRLAVVPVSTDTYFGTNEVFQNPCTFGAKSVKWVASPLKECCWDVFPRKAVSLCAHYQHPLETKHGSLFYECLKSVQKSRLDHTSTRNIRRHGMSCLFSMFPVSSPYLPWGPKDYHTKAEIYESLRRRIIAALWHRSVHQYLALEHVLLIFICSDHVVVRHFHDIFTVSPSNPNNVFGLDLRTIVLHAVVIVSDAGILPRCMAHNVDCLTDPYLHWAQ